MVRRVLITGASGLLGSYLLRTADERLEVVGTFWTHRTPKLVLMDLLHPDHIARVFAEFMPEVVIHCAGEGRVDFVEKFPAQGQRVNINGTFNLLKETRKQKSHFVYISSNAVFAGDNPPYREDSPREPVNEYGRLKKEAEDVVTTYYSGRSLIIRPIMLYGWPPPWQRENFVTRLINHPGEIKVAKDIMTQPTYAGDCAKAIWKAIRLQKDPHEILNLAPKEKMTLFKFAGEIVKAFELDPDKVVPVSSKSLRSFAPRPKDTTYDTVKMETMRLDLMGPAEGLRAMKEEENAA